MISSWNVFWLIKIDYHTMMKIKAVVVYLKDMKKNLDFIEFRNVQI